MPCTSQHRIVAWESHYTVSMNIIFIYGMYVCECGCGFAIPRVKLFFVPLTSGGPWLDFNWCATFIFHYIFYRMSTGEGFSCHWVLDYLKEETENGWLFGGITCHGNAFWGSLIFCLFGIRNFLNQCLGCRTVVNQKETIVTNYFFFAVANGTLGSLSGDYQNDINETAVQNWVGRLGQARTSCYGLSLSRDC